MHFELYCDRLPKVGGAFFSRYGSVLHPFYKQMTIGIIFVDLCLRTCDSAKRINTLRFGKSEVQVHCHKALTVVAIRRMRLLVHHLHSVALQRRCRSFGSAFCRHAGQFPVHPRSRLAATSLPRSQSNPSKPCTASAGLAFLSLQIKALDKPKAYKPADNACSNACRHVFGEVHAAYNADGAEQGCDCEAADSS